MYLIFFHIVRYYRCNENEVKFLIGCLTNSHSIFTRTKKFGGAANFIQPRGGKKLNPALIPKFKDASFQTNILINLDPLWII